MATTNISNQKVSTGVMDEIAMALKSVRSYGSIEIYIQKGIVTQITVRNIKKTNSKIK